MAILKNLLFTKCIKNFCTPQFKSLGYLSKNICLKRYLSTFHIEVDKKGTACITNVFLCHICLTHFGGRSGKRKKDPVAAELCLVLNCLGISKSQRWHLKFCFHQEHGNSK